MKENNIDKLFRDKLAKGDFAYKEAYWQQMEKALPTGNAAATGWFTGKYLLGAILALASVGTLTWWIIAGSGTTDVTIEDQPSVNQPELTNQYEPSQVAPVGNITDEEITNTEAKAANDDLEQHAIVTSNSVTNNGSSTEQSLKGIKTDAGIATSAETATEETIAEKAALTTRNKTESFLTASENQQTKETALPGIASKTSITSESGFTEISSAETKGAEEQTQSFVSRPPILTTKQNFDTQIEDANKPAIIRPQHSPKSWQTSVGLEYSYLFINRSLSSSNADLENYITFRNQYENPKSTSGIGLSLQFERKGWLLNTGVNLVNITEEINYPTTLNVLTGIDNGSWNVKQNWSYAVDSNWVIDSIFAGHWSYDTAWSVTYDSTWASQWDSVYTEKEDPNIAQNNRITALSYLEVPLLFGKSFGKNRLYFDIQVGGAIGILTGTSGSVYINSRVDALLSPDAHLEQFRRYNASFMFRTGVRFAITPQIQAAFYPTLRYTLTNVFTSDAIKQRYFGYGLTLGLRYQF